METSSIAISSAKTLRASRVSAHASIYNGTALLNAYQSIHVNAFPFSVSFQSISCTQGKGNGNIDDDLQRETLFYRQCLDDCATAFDCLHDAGVPLSRPQDYFAEMIKDDEHMSKLKKRMTEAAASKVAAADARKQRELRKFGKRLQVAKERERHKEKRQNLAQIEAFKRRKLETSISEADHGSFNSFMNTSKNHRSQISTEGIKSSNQKRRKGKPFKGLKAGTVRKKMVASTKLRSK